MGCLLQTSIAYAPVESADFDCVARWTEGDVTHHCPVQLKELPPETVTPLISLQSEIDKLAKYANSPDLCVAYYLNRNVRITFDALVIPKLNLGSLWFNGGVSKTKIRWMLWGNLLDSPRQFEFEYPA